MESRYNGATTAAGTGSRTRRPPEARLTFDGSAFRIVVTNKGYRKIPPVEFTRLYRRGVKMTVIARRFGVSVQACKDMRKKLGLKPRPPHRVKNMSKLVKGMKVMIVTPGSYEEGGNPRLHGTEATVRKVEEWGAYLDAPAAATGEFRAHWSEMKLVGEPAGKACHECGGMLIRTGTCETCQNCGWNEGCG